MLAGAGLLIGRQAPKLLYGSSQVLVPARAMLGDVVTLDHSMRQVTCYHILCQKHVVLRANEMPAERLFPGHMAQDSLVEASRCESEAAFPELAGFDQVAEAVSAHPMLTLREARLLRPLRS